MEHETRFELASPSHTRHAVPACPARSYDLLPHRSQIALKLAKRKKREGGQTLTLSSRQIAAGDDTQRQQARHRTARRHLTATAHTLWEGPITLPMTLPWTGATTQPARPIGPFDRSVRIDLIRSSGIGTAESTRPDCLAVSANALSRDARALAEAHRDVSRACRRLAIDLVLGGQGRWPERIRYGHRLRKFRELHVKFSG